MMGSLRTRRLMTLTDRLDRQGDLFLEWASATFGDGERRGSGELPEDNSSSADKSISPNAAASLPLSGREGGNRQEGSRDCSTRPVSNWVRRHSFSSCNRFACSRSSATGLVLLSCFQFLAPEEELVFGGYVCWIASHGAEFRRSCGRFGNREGFADRGVIWEWVYLSSCVPPL